MWGQDAEGILYCDHAGIIPMRVGTSANTGNCSAATNNHPHACGDKRNIVLPLRTVIGSSPCVWGQDSYMDDIINGTRIIPMRVGTRFFLFSQTLFGGDHPHACGDKCGVACVNTNRRGSSPCVWGQAG